MKLISGGVCAAQGFRANGVHCGIRKNHSKKDLALIVSEVPAAAAAVYTTNLVKGAPLTVTKNNIADGKAQAVICNSGNANTCNANGIEIAEAMCDLVEQHTGISSSDVWLHPPASSVSLWISPPLQTVWMRCAKVFPTPAAWMLPTRS